MDDNNKNTVSWFIAVFIVAMTVMALVISLPSFVGVEKIKYATVTQQTNTITTISAIKPENETTIRNTTKTNEQTQTEFPIDLNTATTVQLMKVPGIGEVFASRIVLFREENGRFNDLSELLQIKGIGKKRLEKWMPYLTVSN